MDFVEIENLTRRVKDENHFIAAVKKEIAGTIIGQEKLVDRMLISFITGGHILVEGLPGLAKTLAVKSFARAVDVEFSRVQFTPDLLPADLTGTQIFNPGEMSFFTRKGPVFTNFLLADEINRAPAKVQSALLQAMEEKQVTIGDKTYSLPEPFMVLATENPIEQEGTYPLPEAQLDRFFMKVIVDYPSFEDEKNILLNHNRLKPETINRVVTPQEIASKRVLIDSIYINEKLMEYIVTLVGETRKAPASGSARLIEFGASPRASIAIMKASRCAAFMKGRGFVTPDDIKEIAPDVLRHRIILSYQAEAEGRSPDDVIRMVLESVEVP